MIRLYKFLPSRLFNWTSAQLKYSDAKISPEKFSNNLIISSIILGVIGFILAEFIVKRVLLESIGIGIGTFLLVFFIQLFIIMNAADSRGKKVEDILPDALQLISSNIKSGLTTERALLASALPEFGVLSKELIEASKALLAGANIESALSEISTKIKSNVFERSMWLLIQGIRNGGQISNLLLQMSNDLREENALKAEVSANISMYVLLIFFSAALGAPALFGISSFIVGVLSSQAGSVGIDADQLASYAAKSPALGLVGLPSAAITEDFIVVFSIAALILTSLFAAFVLGIINTGKEKGGIKYIPILLIVSIILFFVVRILVKGSFGGLVK